jgi:hypothetical protein
MLNKTSKSNSADLYSPSSARKTSFRKVLVKAAEYLHVAQQNVINAISSLSSLNDALEESQRSLVLAKSATDDKRCAASDTDDAFTVSLNDTTEPSHFWGIPLYIACVDRKPSPLSVHCNAGPTQVRLRRCRPAGSVRTRLCRLIRAPHPLLTATACNSPTPTSTNRNSRQRFSTSLQHYKPTDPFERRQQQLQV